MDKNKVKKIIRPIVQECIREMIFEKGFLSNIIQEVMDANGEKVISESQPYKKHLEHKVTSTTRRSSTPTAYDDIASSTEEKPVKKASSEYNKYGALKDVDPSNPGVSIDKLLEGMNFKVFND